MKKIFILLSLCLGLCGCAGLQNQRNEDKLEVSNYFVNPHNKLLVRIVTLNDSGLGEIKCTCDSGNTSNTGSHGNSFKTYTPFVQVDDLSEKLNKLQEMYNALPENDKVTARMEMLQATPYWTYVCQAQGLSGIEGRMYFNGNEVSSDVANVEYGVITLRYALTPEDLLSEK